MPVPQSILYLYLQPTPRRTLHEDLLRTAMPPASRQRSLSYLTLSTFRCASAPPFQPGSYRKDPTPHRAIAYFTLPAEALPFQACHQRPLNLLPTPVLNIQEVPTQMTHQIPGHLTSKYRVETFQQPLLGLKSKGSDDFLEPDQRCPSLLHLPCILRPPYRSEIAHPNEMKAQKRKTPPYDRSTIRLFS